MKIAIYGYGRLGRLIEEAASEQGHSVTLRVNSSNAGAIPVDSDVAIDVSRPDTAVANIKLCLENNVPIVVGTTGWYDQLDNIANLVNKNKGSVLVASNFNLGVNLLFRINKMIAQLMNHQAEYRVKVDEVHHRNKLDKPSGTALHLIRDISGKVDRYDSWKFDSSNIDLERNIAVTSTRKGDFACKHKVTWLSGEDRITVAHEVFNRTGFAHGAIAAAKWIIGRHGLFTMDEVLDLPNLETLLSSR